MAAKNQGTEIKTKETRRFIYDKLKKGRTPYQIIPLVMEEFGIGESRATVIVYDCNKILKANVQEMAEDAANYIMNNLKCIVEEARDNGDNKSALKGLEQIAKITKLYSDTPQVTVNNYGFEFDTEEEND